jgi:hypothetical protein
MKRPECSGAERTLAARGQDSTAVPEHKLLERISGSRGPSSGEVFSNSIQSPPKTTRRLKGRTTCRSLAELLAPMDPTNFLRATYGVRYAHVTGSPGRGGELFSWDTLNRVLLLMRNHLGSPGLRLIKAGKDISPGEYFGSFAHGPDTVHREDWQKIQKALREGATLKLTGADELHEPIRELCRALEFELRSRVHANVYAGWFTHRGFNTHWDDHDVIILQIEGRKRWRIFRPNRKHPVSEDRRLKLQAPSRPCWKGELQPGDILYIPRGWWHDAKPVGEPTLHITFGIYRQTGLDLARAMVSSLSELEHIRADLPMFGTVQDQKAYMRAFCDAVRAATDRSLASYLHECDRNAPGRILPALPWSVMPESVPYGDSLWIHWLPPRRIVLEQVGDEVTFAALGSTFRFKKALAPLLISISTQIRVRFSSLRSPRFHLSRADLESFVQHLVLGGLVAVSET